MKKVVGYSSIIVNVECKCPYCDMPQVDCECDKSQIDTTVIHICEVCGKKFKIEIQ